MKEQIPEQTNLSEEKLYQFEEIRDHSIKDILCRVYTIANLTIPTGGLPGDILYTLDPLTVFLNQTNVKAKLSKFAALRANIVIRTLITSTRTCSGAIMPQYIPQLGTQRSTTLLQQSQSIRKVIPLASGEQVDIEAPWVDPFLARNLASNTGKLGTFRISRVTPSQIDSVKVKIQIFVPEASLRVEYPTFIDQPPRLADLKVERERISDLIIRMEAKPKVTTAPIYPQMQMNSLRNMFQKMSAMVPRHEPPNSPITVVKWQQGRTLLNDEGDLPRHSLTVKEKQEVETCPGQFGSAIDEMDVETVANSENIISVFPISTSDAVHAVLYARPCTITDFIGSTTSGVTTMSITHQTFLATMAQQWSANLHFKICGTHNQLHSYQVRSMFVPADTGKYTVGQTMSLDDVNATKGQVHKFGADKMIGEHTVCPMATTNMKNVPSPRNVAGVASLANWTANQYLHENSYGMFYVIVEVPLVAPSQVAPMIYSYIDFHASDIILAEPEAWLYLMPQTQMKGLEGQTLSQVKDKTKSQIMSRGQMAQTIEKTPNRASTIKQSLGEEIVNLKQLATAATVFSNSFTNTAAQGYIINPHIFRTTSSQVPADVGQYNDHIDYLFSAYGYFKGGIDVHYGRRSPASSDFGETILVSPRNNWTGTTLSTPNGIKTFTASNGASSSARVSPSFTEEAVVRVRAPYIQPFNINRTTTLDGFDNGSCRKYVVLRPWVAATLRFYRSASSDFALGFLTSLPQYTLNVAATIYT